MIIKEPASIDVSRYRIIPDWTVLAPPIYLGITKATQGVSYVDPTFGTHIQGMQQAGIHRGMYHYHEKARPPVDQARHFCNTIRPYVTEEDLLILDVEEGDETAAQLKAWFEEVMRKFPDNLLFIYSRKNILDSVPMFLRPLAARFLEHPLDAIPMSIAERTFFRKNVKTWTAGYPNNPDLFNSVPSFYIPDQTKWGPVWLWQYTEKGQVGASEGVDCNWVAPELIAMLGPVSEPPTQPPADVITEPHPGMQRISGVRHGWKFELFKNDPAKVRFESVCLSPLETVSSVARRKGATLAVPGGEPTRDGLTMKDYTVSNGEVCAARTIAAPPSLMILNDNSIVIDYKATPNVRQAFSGVIPLVQNGQVVASLYDTSKPDNTEGHARNIHCKNAAGHHMVLESEGVYPNQGMKHYQTAELLVEYGAETAFFSSGGGDASCNLDGVSLIVPENINPDTGQHFERALPNVFLIYAEGETPMPTEDYYKYTPKKNPSDPNDAGARAIRVSWGVRSSRIQSNSDFLYNTIAKGGALPENRKTLTAEDVVQVGGMVNDVWVQVYDNNGKPVNGWTAKTHMGITQISEELIDVTPEPEPPPTTSKQVKITVEEPGYKPVAVIVNQEPE